MVSKDRCDRKIEIFGMARDISLCYSVEIGIYIFNSLMYTYVHHILIPHNFNLYTISIHAANLLTRSQPPLLQFLVVLLDFVLDGLDRLEVFNRLHVKF